MADSWVPTIIPNLVALFTPISDVLVSDGPKLTGEQPTGLICVGWNGEEDYRAATVRQEFAGLGAKKKSETIGIPCCIIFRDGAASVSTARTGAFAIFNEVSTALRGDLSLGLPAPAVAQIDDYDFSQAPSSRSGIEARIVFNVTITARI